MFDREGYLFSISGGWKKTLKIGPYKYRVSNLEVRIRTNKEDWSPEELRYRKPKKIHWWEEVDWERIRKYWVWRGKCVLGFFKKISNLISPKPVDAPLH